MSQDVDPSKAGETLGPGSTSNQVYPYLEDLVSRAVPRVDLYTPVFPPYPERDP